MSAPKLEDIMAAVGPAIERMVSIDPGSRLIFTITEVEIHRVAVGCRDIAAALEPGVNRDHLLEVAAYAEHIATALNQGSHSTEWINRAKTLCN